MSLQKNPVVRSLLPRVGVGVLILDDRCRALLTLRKLPPEAGSWSIVGGKLEYLETLQDCAVREALEEVGVAISIEGLLCVTDHLLPHESQHWVSPDPRSPLVPSQSTPTESHYDRQKRHRLVHSSAFSIVQSPCPLML
jgi:8-oxo-dGTP pyrophosphatase MutT (NUDIX family)